MSMIKCYSCAEIFCTDDDPECWVEIGNMRRMTTTEAVCQRCRDAAEMDEMRAEQEMETECPVCSLPLDDGNEH